MKRIKNLKLLIVVSVIWQLFAACIPVYAAGTATIGFSGNSSVTVGSNITIKMYVKSINDVPGGITSISGNLSFDSEYLEYVSGTGATSPLTFSINPSNNYVIGGLAFDGSAITGTAENVIFTFEFKALKAGTTQIALNNTKVSDINVDKVTMTVSPKTITIGASQPAKSSDATLKSLAATGYTLSPSFASGTTSYTITVPSGTTSVTLTGAANHSAATVTGLGSVTLTGDTTTASVKVKAEDGTTKTYTVKINREKQQEPETPTKSSDATLKSLSASGYTLSPSFSSSTTSYTVKVPSTATTVKLEGEANDSKATVTGLGDITLTGDSTTATIKVKAEDGTTKTYTVKIEKETEKEDEPKKDSDATLKKLDVSGYTLSPTFKKDVNTYSIKVKNSVTGLDIDAIPTSDKAEVTISGNKNWKEGNNVVTIKVTAEDGTTNTYTVNVNRESSKTDGSTPKEDPKSSNNYLKNLTIKSSHETDKTFNKDISVYNITVPYEVDKLDLSAVASNSKADVKITGNSNFKVGEVNIVEIEVTAEDGSKRIYTLNVTRSTKVSDNDLEDIIIGGGVTLSPKFDPDITDYTTTVGGGVDKLDITAIPKEDGSKVEIIGNENLKEGNNTVLIKVTDKDGFSKYYTIQVQKEAKDNTILGLSPLAFGIVSGIIGLLLLLLLFLLFRRKKEVVKEERDYHTPIIEVKPEFNFGSKNTSDDDVVHGNLNQNSDIKEEREYELPKYKTPAIEADYEEEVPYDPYDETVTKRELIDAIHEATRTKDPSKLKMLLEQDALNQKKKELKKREELNKEEDTDDWR